MIDSASPMFKVLGLQGKGGVTVLGSPEHPPAGMLSDLLPVLKHGRGMFTTANAVKQVWDRASGQDTLGDAAGDFARNYVSSKVPGLLMKGGGVMQRVAEAIAGSGEAGAGVAGGVPVSWPVATLPVQPSQQASWQRYSQTPTGSQTSIPTATHPPGTS
jgi:hypothetical protein